MMKIFILITMIVMVMAMGCTTVDTHEKYTQATIVEKFEKTQPMPFVDPSQVANPAWYYHDYYIRYTVGEIARVDRVSENVYSSISEGNTYVLKWGYVDELSSKKDEYGYVEVIAGVKV